MNPVFKFLLLILFVWSGCAENSVEPEEELPPIVPITSNNIIPLAIGNQWTYVDSLFYEDTVLVETYTVRIQSKRHIEDEEYIDRNLVWWKFNGRFNPSITAVEFASKGDTLYSLQETPGAPSAESKLIAVSSLEYIIPEGNDTIRFISRFNGDGAYDKYSSFVNKFIDTPSDSVKGYINLYYRVFSGIYSEVIIPKIGMVHLEVSNIPSISGENWIKRRLNLIDYNIAE